MRLSLADGEVGVDPLVLGVGRRDTAIPSRPASPVAETPLMVATCTRRLADPQLQDPATVALGDERAAVGQEPHAPRHGEVGGDHLGPGEVEAAGLLGRGGSGGGDDDRGQGGRGDHGGGTGQDGTRSHGEPPIQTSALFTATERRPPYTHDGRCPTGRTSETFATAGHRDLARWAGAADRHDHPLTRPPTSATCWSSTPTGCTPSTLPTGTRVRLLPRGDRRSGARRRCCSRSTRSAWSRAPGRPARARTASRSASTSTTGPYAASSLLAVALNRVFRTAMRGALRRPPRAGRARPIPLEIQVPVLRCRGGAELADAAVRAARLAGRRATPIPLDETHPEWGDSRYVDLHADRRRSGWPTRSTTSTCCCRCSTTPSTTGSRPTRSTSCCGPARAGWPSHPERDLITRRYLAHRRALAARRRWSGSAEARDDRGRRRQRRRRRARRGRRGGRAAGGGRAQPLAVQRRDAVLAALAEAGAARVLDLGCGAGALLARAAQGPARSPRSSAWTSRRGRWTWPQRRLRLDRLPDAAARPGHAVPVGADLRATTGCAGFDAAVLMEVIEHVDPPRLPALERRRLRPRRARRTVVVTTPNVEYNVRYEGLAAGRAAPPRPPLRVDPGRVRGLGGRRRRPATATAVAAARRRRGRPGGRRRRPSWPSSPGTEAQHDRRSTSPSWRWSCWSASPARASRRSPASTSRPTQVLSSDAFRGLVADDENDQSATAGRLRRAALRRRQAAAAGRLTVVDATNVQPHARAGAGRSWPASTTCCRWRSCSTCRRRCAGERNAGPAGPRLRPRRCSPGSTATCARSLRQPGRGRASARSTCCAASDEIDAAEHRVREAVQRPTRADRPVRHHRRRARLPGRAGDAARPSSATRSPATTPAAPVDAAHPDGRTRGLRRRPGRPRPGHARRAAAGHGHGRRRHTRSACAGNHEAQAAAQAARAATSSVTPRPGRDAGAARRRSRRSSATAVEPFIDGLICHYVLDGGRLVVAHAGLKEAYHGRASGRVRVVRAVRRHHRRDRRVRAAGALPVGPRLPRRAPRSSTGTRRRPTPEWVNNTICLDTGCVFGGALTALRYPERELVSVPAAQEYYEPVRPLHAAGRGRRASRTCSTSPTSPAAGGSRPRRTAGSASRPRTRRPRWR